MPPNNERPSFVSPLPDPVSLDPVSLVVKHGTKYYDPSYGSPTFTTLSEWENNSLAGVGALFVGGTYNAKDSKKPGNTTVFHLWFEKPNANGTEECDLQQ